MPGERALKLREQRLAEGLPLHPEIMPSLEPWAAKLGVAMP
jgi:LDH2 family malate/lactate/ureidoglycolate dehydrogenase